MSVCSPALARTAAAVFAFLVLGVPMSAAAAPQPPKNAVHAEGCVEAGVAAHCLVLKDIRTGHIYDLLFQIPARPPVGLGIEFTGVLHPGPTSCMQGTAVEVTNWVHKASIRCAPGRADKAGRAPAH